jgi:hypothetical protein
MKPVDLVDEEEIAMLDICQDTGKVTRLFDLGTAGDVDVGFERVAKNVGQRRFSESGRTAEKNVIERIAALPGGFDHQHEAFLDLLLAPKLTEIRWAEALLELRRRRFGEVGLWVFRHGDGEISGDPPVEKYLEMGKMKKFEFTNI